MCPVPPAASAFRRRVPRRTLGLYAPATDTLAVAPSRATSDGLGGEDGYYVVLLEELLHATGHRSRLGRSTTGSASPSQRRCEEATVNTALRAVLEELGFPEEALEWYLPARRLVALGSPDKGAARPAAAWVLAP